MMEGRNGARKWLLYLPTMSRRARKAGVPLAEAALSSMNLVLVVMGRCRDVSRR